MSKSIRIRTTPGGDDKYVSVNLEQNFNQLNVLSLTITQEDAYRSFESNYGVVAGRVDINNGFGLKNVKVSIFIPLTESDKQDEIISQIYPYETISDKNSNGVRYNILPNTKQNKNHTPVGTFPNKRQILDNATMVEIYDKYYKFTTTTNDSGDYMFFGVPVGEQRVFIDADVSDIGFLSARPYELIAKGKPKEEFEDNFTFKSGNDLDKLPQIINKSEIIEVLPFWSDDLEISRKVGITRFDYSITDYDLTPTAIFMGSLFSDSENNALSQNGMARKKMGKMSELITGGGNIEAITRTSNGGIIKSKDIPKEAIDENGNWAFDLPMNLRKLVTDEFGALVPSPDGDKGVFSEGDYRFRISMGTNGITKKSTRAKLLVPNMTNNYEFDVFSSEELKTAQEIGNPIFKINRQLSFFNESDPAKTDPTIQYNYLEDFYTFRWKKVYTVRQYIPRYQPNPSEGSEQRNFTGIKNILDGSGNNKLPYNRLFTKTHPLYNILCYILTVYGWIVAFVNTIVQFINSVISNICELRIVWYCLNSGFENAGGRTLQATNNMKTQRYDGSSWGSVVGIELGGSANHVLGASNKSSSTSWSESGQLNNYYNEDTWIDGWRGIWTLFSGKKGDDEQRRAKKRREQQNWIHNKESLSVAEEEDDDDIDSNDCGRPSDWVGESLGAEGGWKTCWTFRGDIPSKRRIRNCIGYELLPLNGQSDVYIAQSPWFEEYPNKRWWRASNSNTNRVDEDPDIDEDIPQKMWRVENVWYSSPDCMKIDTQGKTGVSYVGCRRINVSDFNYEFINKKWWKRDFKVRKCDKPECEDGIRILGICITFAPAPTWIAPLKGLCNTCTNDDEVDPEAPNNGKGPSLIPGIRGDGYGVNKNCCDGCPSCDKYGSDIYFNDKAEENGKTVKGAARNCLNGVCCEKIAPIGLKCASEGSIFQPTLRSIGNCGVDDVVRECKTCTGVFWYNISDWVECSLEQLATNLGMLDLDFYNDWINGSLYFPAIKRNLKIRKRRKGRGQVQKDVFCDYDCDGTGNGPDYQTDSKEIVYSVKLLNKTPKGRNITDFEFEGCQVKLPKKISSKEWYSDKFDAFRSIEFKGYYGGDITKPCEFTLNDYCTKNEGGCKDKSIIGEAKKLKIKTKKVETEHGRPIYLKTTVDTDGDGETDTEIWKNFGGHGHHKNKCKPNFLIERHEYLKGDLSDCQTMNTEARGKKGDPENTVVELNQIDDVTGEDINKKTYVGEELKYTTNTFRTIKHNLRSNSVNVKIEYYEGGWKDITGWTDVVTWRPETKNKLTVKWTGDWDINIRVTVVVIDDACALPCGVQGTAACTSRCPCNSAYYSNLSPVYRGLVKEKDNEIYYASIVEGNDRSFNNDSYKKNMLFPTNITELGSSVTCDIDESPFIIGDLETTSYKLSEEDLKSNGGRGTEKSPYKLIEGTSIVNLSAYVDFGCNGVRCLNVRGSLTASQTGSELFDLNDSGLECNTCSIYSDVDTDLREYFCKRFSTYSPSVKQTADGVSILDMKVNYVRSGGREGENFYESYNEMSPKCREEFNKKVAAFVDSDGSEGTSFVIDNDLNNGDNLVPGDKCGLYDGNNRSDVKYFYGMDASKNKKNNLGNYPFNSSKLGLSKGGFGGEDSGSKLVNDSEGISPFTTQTPYFFYFGLVPGKTALNKVVGKYFSDIIDFQTLEDITGDENSDGDGNGGNDNDDNNDDAINAIIGSCLKN